MAATALPPTQQRKRILAKILPQPEHSLSLQTAPIWIVVLGRRVGENPSSSSSRASEFWSLREGSCQLFDLLNTNPYCTKVVAVGRSGCARGAHKIIVWWSGVGRRGCRVAIVCVLFLKPPAGLSGVVSFLCVVLPRRGLCAKSR
jgi:hypothetical protein